MFFLIIEDDPGVARTVRWSIEDIAPNAEIIIVSAIKEVQALTEKRNDIDAVILDNILPDGDGIDFLRKLPTSKCQAVVFMTATGNINLKYDARKLGVRFFLDKPFTYNQLKEAIQAICYPMAA